MVVVPGGYDHKTWWRNLRAPRTPADVAHELYELGYQRAAIQDGHTLVAGVDTDPNNHRHWWTSLEPASPPSTS